MLLGLAVGNALGATTESISPNQRRESHGEISDYLFYQHYQESRGFPSDDSQMAFWTLEQLLLDDGLIPANLAQRFSRARIFWHRSDRSGIPRESQIGNAVVRIRAQVG